MQQMLRTFELRSLTQIRLYDTDAGISPSHCTAITKVDDADGVTENYSIWARRTSPKDH